MVEEYRKQTRSKWLAHVIVRAIYSPGMSEIVREIGSQPEMWRRAARLAVELERTLPGPHERVAAVGCGTSLYVAQAYASLREAAGGYTDAFAASEMPGGRAYDVIVAISRSGTTTEVERLLEGLPDGRRSIAIVGVDHTPITVAASERIVLDFADERSIVQTRFATSALALLRAHVGQDLEPVAGDGDRALAADLPLDPAVYDHFVFLGRGWTVALANEAALKLEETSGSRTEAHPAMEYRHGPISAAGPSSAVWPLGDVGADLLEDIAATGATVVESGLGPLDPMAELILIQRAAVALAVTRGLDPDRPRHLTRSVMLS
jgi:fructoselysine-6-P-deglycase FrlB-like protein